MAEGKLKMNEGSQASESGGGQGLTRTERRQQRTRARLIAGVRKLTAEKGVDALTIRDIADEADIAMGSFYSYFESKEALLGDALREIAFQSGEIIDRINADKDDPLEIISTAFMTFDGIVQDDPILGWFIVRISAYNPEWTSTLYDRFLRDVSEGINQGVFAVPNVSIAIDSVTASFYSFYRARLCGEAGGDAVPDFVQLMLRLLGADDAAARQMAYRVWAAKSKENS